jgi:para-aminobenzoate synthetase component 1
LHLGDLLFSLLPAGSISGAPKKKTIETIQESEACPRGYYTGVAFYFDGEHIDSCVMIRFIEKVNGEYFYRSGGGITVNSDMEKEYQELNDKIYVPIY